MIFQWEMSEEQWECLCEDAELDEGDYDDISEYGEGGDVYGNLLVGRLNAEISHSWEDEQFPCDHPWGIWVDVFAEGIDDDYNTSLEFTFALTKITFEVPLFCDSFTEFKQECERRFEAAIKAAKPSDTVRVKIENMEDPIVLANAELVKWE